MQFEYYKPLLLLSGLSVKKFVVCLLSIMFLVHSIRCNQLIVYILSNWIFFLGKLNILTHLIENRSNISCELVIISKNTFQFI